MSLLDLIGASHFIFFEFLLGSFSSMPVRVLVKVGNWDATRQDTLIRNLINLQVDEMFGFFFHPFFILAFR